MLLLFRVVGIKCLNSNDMQLQLFVAILTSVLVYMNRIVINKIAPSLIVLHQFAIKSKLSLWVGCGYEDRKFF